METRRMQPVTERSTWQAQELGADETWRYTLSGTDLNELEDATALACANGLRPGEFSRDDFPLPTLGPRIAALADEVENGRFPDNGHSYHMKSGEFERLQKLLKGRL